MQKNRDWSEKNPATVKLYLSVASRGMKTYSESRIEMRNPQMLKKMQFLSSEQSCKLKRLDVALNIAGVEKIRSENLPVAVNTGGDLIRVLN